MRKTHIPRRSIVAGEVIHGFEVIRQVPSVCGKRMVEVKCAACPDGIGTCRFTELCDGTVKSCRCLSKLAFTTNQTAFAEALTKDQVSQIFTDIHLGLDKFAIKAKHNIRSSYTVDFVKRMEYVRLEAIPAAIRTEIYELAQVNVDAAMWKFKMTRAEVLAVCAIQRQQATAATVAKPAAEESIDLWNKISTEVKDELNDAHNQTMAAVESICGFNATGAVQDEDLLLPSELKWITKLTEVLKALPASTHSGFGGLSTKAKSIVIKSQIRNFESMRTAILNREAGKTRTRRKSKGKKMGERMILPYDPNFTARALVQGFNIMHEIKRAA
jgi:hypothetical protein